MTTYKTKWEGSIKAIDATVNQSKKTQAGVEAENYEFGQIPESDYMTCLDTKNDAAYVLLRIGEGTEQEIGCSCDYFKENRMTCEHLYALRDIDVSKLVASPNWLLEFLQVDNGWHVVDGKFQPPSMDDSGEPIPKPEKKPKAPVGKKPATQKAPVIPPTPEVDIGVGEKPMKKHICKLCGKECKNIDELLIHQEKCKQKQEDAKLPTLIDEDMTWSASQIEVMRKTVAIGTTNEEFAYFLNVAKAAGLNPFLREIYCWKTEKGQLTIATGRDGYLAIAKRDPKFRGMQSMEVCENDDFTISNEITPEGIKQTITHNITNFKDRGVVIGAWARADFDDQEPIIVYASAEEYNTKKNVWARNPSAMMRKVPEAMALKRGAGISGLVTDAEVSESHIIDAEMI